jgi:hypothetical protein
MQSADRTKTSANLKSTGTSAQNHQPKAGPLSAKGSKPRYSIRQGEELRMPGV